MSSLVVVVVVVVMLVMLDHVGDSYCCCLHCVAVDHSEYLWVDKKSV